MNKVLDLTYNDVHDPKYGDLNVWVGRTATSDQSIEFNISGLLHMQQENLTCTLTKHQALQLAYALIDHLENN